MSETTVAIAVLPVLVALVIVLEYTRIGCMRLIQHVRAVKSQRR